MGETNLQYDNSTSNLKNQKRPTDTESEKLLSLKLQEFPWSLFSSIPSPVYL